MRRMRNIVVSGHCQSSGVALALGALLDHDRVVNLQLPADSAETPSPQWLESVRAADVWVHGAGGAFLRRHALDCIPGQLRLGLPLIYFDAFHPDLCYLWLKSAARYTKPDYNSAIAAWAWLHGVPEMNVPALFNARTFDALGYTRRWPACVAHLRATFAATGWTQEFMPFMRSIQRTGSFMHSMNHPKVHVLVRLARMLAYRLGAGAHAWTRPVDVDDTLSVVTWPVYPGIADALGLADGSYQWRLYDQRYQSLPAFVSTAYDHYRHQQLDSGAVKIGEYDMALLDRVLGPQSEAAFA